MKFKIKEKIIRLFGGYTSKDLEKYIIEDRKSREVPRTIQFQATIIGKSDAEKDAMCKKKLYNSIFEHIIDNSTIKQIYNPIGDYTNYFLIYDMPFEFLKEEIDYNNGE